MLRLVLLCLPSVWRRLPTWATCLPLVVPLLTGCTPQSSVPQPAARPGAAAPATGRAEDLLVVDCLLPGQVRKLGRQLTYLTPRRPVKTSARDCEIRGGEYVAYDRSDYRTALNVWLPQAKEGDKEAQTYVGEIYEKGLGVQPDYAVAAAWYRKAAEQGDSRAQINLGHLYEKGLGVEPDPAQALAWYRKASGLSETAISLDAGSIPWAASGTDVQQELQTLRQEVERWRQKAATLRQQLDQTRRQLDQTRQALEQRQRGLEIEQRRLDQTRRQLERRKQQLDAATTHDNAARQRRETQLQQRIAELEQQQQDLIRAQQAERQAMLRAQQVEQQKLTQTRQAFERRKQQLDAAATRDDAELQRLQTQLEQRTAELERQRQNMRQLQQADQRKLAQTRQALERQQQQLDAAATRDDAELQHLQAQLKQQTAELERQRQDVLRLQQEKARLEDDAKQHRVQLARLEQQQQQVALAGPTIEMIDPPVAATRGLSVVTVSPGIIGQQREIIGRVTSPAGLLSLTVNDRQEHIDDNGLFRMAIPVRGNSVPVKVVAVDKQGKRASVEFQLSTATADMPMAPKPAALPHLQLGTYYALVIGNQTYMHWPHLRTPAGDAKTMADVLSKKYGFKTRLLLDATRFDILQALNELRKSLIENDNLLIYYAGHGHWEEKIQRGYWVPVDGDLDSNVNWISTVAITDILSAMSARHILVIADSCYSGALTRSALARLAAGMSDAARRHWIKAMAEKRSRTVLSSGALEPVLDSGGGQHSVFAKAFLDVLDANDDILVGQQIYSQVAARVTYAADAMAVEQNPQYAPIRYAGHEAGDFILIPSVLQ